MSAAVHAFTGSYQPDPRGIRTDPDLLHDILFSLGYGYETARQYAATLRRVAAWCADHGLELDNISGMQLPRLTEDWPSSHASRKALRSALSAYWGYIERDNPPLGAVRTPKRPRGLPRPYEPDEACRLAQVARSWEGAEGVMVMLALYMGLRRSEIATLRWDNFHGDGWMTVLGKFDILADLPVPSVAEESLDRWRDSSGPPYAGPSTARCRPGEVWVFESQRTGTSRSGDHISGAAVGLAVARLGKVAGIEHAEPHRLRHTFLTTANDGSRDLRTVQMLARHRDPATTAIYTRVTRERMTEVTNGVDYGVDDGGDRD